MVSPPSPAHATVALVLLVMQPHVEVAVPSGVLRVHQPRQPLELPRQGCHTWPREREGRPFSTCALAFSESWTEGR